jgi:uncharacterized MAPEG superfamily protein
MSIPVWVLLAFAGWTVLSLILSVGVHRWSRILTGRAALSDYGYVDTPAEGFYHRAMRAHANCVENLPVYGAVVLAIVVTGVQGRSLDVLALVFIAARVAHTGIHLLLEQSSRVVAVRFSFFAVQVVCMAWMGVHTAVAAA